MQKTKTEEQESTEVTHSTDDSQHIEHTEEHGGQAGEKEQQSEVVEEWSSDNAPFNLAIISELEHPPTTYSACTRTYVIHLMCILKMNSKDVGVCGNIAANIRRSAFTVGYTTYIHTEVYRAHYE